MHVGCLLTNAAYKHPARTALIHLDRRWKYEELRRRVNRLGDALAALGVKRGERVALMFYNSNQFVETYFACLHIGAVAVPVNFRFVAPEIEYVVNDSGATVFFYGRDFQAVVSRARANLKGVKCFVTVESLDKAEALDYEDLLQTGRPEDLEASVDEDDPCQIMYTSGTTGKPKGAVLTHRAVLWNLYNTLYGREDREGEIALIIGPLYHTAALNNHLTIQIALGGMSILMQRFDPAAVLETIDREKATTISGPPAMYNRLLQFPEAERYGRTTITKCTAGASILPVEIKRRLETFFPGIQGIYDVYGCTEAAPSISILKAEEALHKEGSVGRALPFLQVRIVDEWDNPLPAGRVGELICRGPNVMLGYHNQPEETQSALRNGWLHTGDLARLDEEGYLFIVDRIKDMINSGGENIYPREVEEVLIRHPEIVDAAVVGMPDPTWGESVCAFVVADPDARLDEKAVVDFYRQHLAGFKKPRRVVFVGEIPRNPSGKILKTKLRRWTEGCVDESAVHS
jgi:fatty-acyl-CoA synthase